MLEPGATIGILGGGQLGRMLAMAAARLGLHCHIYAPEADSVAAEVSAYFTCAPWDDADAMARFAAQCDVITYEFENIPTSALAPLASSHLRPGINALKIAQDRLAEKEFAASLGGRPAPFYAVDHAADLADAVARIGTPGILKTRYNGYDGKGQWRIAQPADMEGLDLPAEADFIYEGFIEFEVEFSVILVRMADGAIHYWDSTQNTHEEGILATSSLPPAPIITAQLAEARALAARVADALDYIGVLTLEFFASPQGPIFNEMAPRVHNSGHWTIEGAATSQFENHIRAVAGLPPGNTTSHANTITMRNLIGPQASDLAGLLADPSSHLHLYGKTKARKGRKMGHITRVGA